MHLYMLTYYNSGRHIIYRLSGLIIILFYVMMFKVTQSCYCDPVGRSSFIFCETLIQLTVEFNYVACLSFFLLC